MRPSNTRKETAISEESLEIFQTHLRGKMPKNIVELSRIYCEILFG